MKNRKILAFTIIESILVIAVIIVISFVLAGLYFKHSKLSVPDSQGDSSPSAKTAESAGTDNP
jgi:type II secretory pathway pseudopilin PulG